MREKVRKLPKAVVILLALLIVAGFVGALRLPDLLGMERLRLPAYGHSMLGEFVVAVYALLVLIIFGYTGILKEKSVGTVKTVFTGGFFVGYVLLQLVAQLYVQAMQNNTSHMEPLITIIFFVSTMLLIGWTEEILFRGVILNMFLDAFPKTKGGILGAVVLNGVMFGGLHMTNYFSGVDLESAAVQSITAGILGIIFAAVYARTRSIWFVIFAHAAVDFVALLGSGIFGAGTEIDSIDNMSWMNLISVPILLIPAIVLLRKSKLEEMEQRANGRVVFETCEEAEGAAAVSLILGILSILTGIMGFGLGLGITGILGSILSKKIKPYENGVAMAGMVTSVIGIVIGVLMAVVMFCMYLMMDFSAMGYDF